jgi:hypothetical protein
MVISIDLEKWQWIFYVAAIIVGIFLIWFIYKKIRHFLRGVRWSSEEKGEIQKRWSSIKSLIDAGTETGFRVAILEADKLFDFALKQRFMPGETLAERLKYAVYKYPNLKRVWWAHKMRNDLVHESTFAVSESLAKRVVREYETALKELGAL